MSALERALDNYLQDHPDGCEISFNAGWHAAMHEATRTRVLIATNHPTGENSPYWKPELTDKYNEAKILVLKGYKKTEACKMVGLGYDVYMRRQRIERHGRDRWYK